MILDDVLTGLDRATEQYILDGVFGPNGLFRQLDSTVIMATSSGKDLYIPPAASVLKYE